MRYSQYFGNKIFHLFFVLPFGVWRYCAQITLNIVVELQFFKARKRAKQPGQKIKTRNDIEACWSKPRRKGERKREIIKSDCVTQPKTSCCTVWKCVFVFFGSTSPQYWISMILHASSHFFVASILFCLIKASKNVIKCTGEKWNGILFYYFQRSTGFRGM